MKQNYYKKVQFWLRFSGWLCLAPASVYLYFYQLMPDSPFSYIFLIELIVIILFAVYILATVKNKRWIKARNILKLMIFAIIFVSIIVAISLYFAYQNSKKFNK